MCCDPADDPLLVFSLFDLANTTLLDPHFDDDCACVADFVPEEVVSTPSTDNQNN